MFIDYGLDDHGELVYINQVQRGQTSLKCPYCGGLLTAKKGQIKAPHFAHSLVTCAAAKRDQEAISLPAYERFNLNVPGKIVEELQSFHTGHPRMVTLDDYGLVKFNEWAGRGGSYELTKKGKLILGELSLNLFIQFQEPLIVEKHEKLSNMVRDVYQKPALIARKVELDRILEETRLTPQGWPTGSGEAHWEARNEHDDIVNTLGPIERASGGADFETVLADLRLYRAQWQRILKCQLYFLRINDGQLHKIGVTMRPIEERVAEISVDLLPHVGAAKIEVVGTWPGRGNVELYFKYRYKANNHPMGPLTEYFKFDDEKPILGDLRRMKKKEYSELELAVVNGQPAEIERAIYAEQVESRRRVNIRKGMTRAAKRGQSIGRPAGGEDVAAFLSKPQSQAVAAALATGTGLREICRQLRVSINTVRKVRSALDPTRQ